MIRALVLVALLATHARADRCESGPMSARPLNKPGARIAGSGGIIVGGDKLPDWRVRVLNKVVRPDVVTLAPGLAIYHPPPMPGDEIVIEDAQHQLRARATRAFTVDPLLAAPQVASITTTGGDYALVVAKLASAAPKGARAVIVSKLDGDRVTPLAWTFVWEAADSLQVFRHPGGCSEYVTSWIEPKRGDRVVLAWVDDTGRVSEASSPIVIGEKK